MKGQESRRRLGRRRREKKPAEPTGRARIVPPGGYLRELLACRPLRRRPVRSRAGVHRL